MTLRRRSTARIVQVGGQQWTEDARNLSSHSIEFGRFVNAGPNSTVPGVFPGVHAIGATTWHDLYMPAYPRPTFPSGKLGMHTDSDDNDEPPPLMADSDQELSPRSSSDHD